ncbi:MAG: O-antigen ligase family protein [Acidobacteriales bacterium]|nr:MAG: O-antigen ligase family protein [Terriglobales bacterium]
MPSASASPGLFRSSALALAVLLSFSVLTLWVRERWAVSLLQVGVFLLGIVWAARWALRPFPLRQTFLYIPLTGTAAWGLLQLLLGTTVYRFDTWNAVLFWSTGLLLAFFAAHALAEPGTRRAFLRALLYFGFGMSVLATTQYFTSQGKIFWLFPSGYPDALGPFVYRNNYAAFIELLLPLAVLEARRDRRHATLHAVMASVMYASVIASASRAGSILVTLEIPATLLLAERCGLVSLRRLGTALVKIGALAAIFISVVGLEALSERFAQADPFVHRREILASSLAMARERPWLGFGLGTFEQAYPGFASFDIGLVVNHAHNDWAEWLAEGGAPFLLLLLSLAAWTLRPALRSLWGIGLIAVFLHALVDYPMQRLGLAAWVFVLLGALAAEELDRRPGDFACGHPRLAGDAPP